MRPLERPHRGTVGTCVADAAPYTCGSHLSPVAQTVDAREPDGPVWVVDGSERPPTRVPGCFLIDEVTLEAAKTDALSGMKRVTKAFYDHGRSRSAVVEAWRLGKDVSGAYQSPRVSQRRPRDSGCHPERGCSRARSLLFDGAR
jgi:hypothetical protein